MSSKHLHIRVKLIVIKIISLTSLLGIKDKFFDNSGKHYNEWTSWNSLCLCRLDYSPIQKSLTKKMASEKMAGGIFPKHGNCLLAVFCNLIIN